MTFPKFVTLEPLLRVSGKHTNTRNLGAVHFTESRASSSVNAMEDLSYADESSNMPWQTLLRYCCW